MRNKTLLAYILPFAAFLGFIALESAIGWLFKEPDVFWLAAPKYWIYPLQTICCAVLLIVFWRSYEFAPLRPWPWGIVAGALALFIWISPQLVFRMPVRAEGFNPEIFSNDPSLYWLTVLSRFARLAVVVPLLEEIFWRGFLMRYLIHENFQKVAFGTYHPLSFFGVALLFMLEHNVADYPAAFLTGLIFNGLAVKTKSLWACVVAHAVTNLGLGLYTMATKQWGFW